MTNFGGPGGFRPAGPRLFPLLPLLKEARVSQHQLSVAVRASGTAVSVAAREGLTVSEAERWSDRVGLMPYEVWPDWFERISIPDDEKDHRSMTTTANTNPERRIRPFSDFLLEIGSGQSHHELSEGLNELVQAVALLGKTGSLTYTVKVAPAGRNAEATVLVTDEIKLKLPEGDRPDSVFFVDADGNVTRDNPAQTRMPLREVRGRDVDADTGEIKEAK